MSAKVSNIYGRVKRKTVKNKELSFFLVLNKVPVFYQLFKSNATIKQHYIKTKKKTAIAVSLRYNKNEILFLQ